MPIEDAQARWSEELSPYRVVAHLTIPAQRAFDPAKEAFFEDLSFSPAHSLADHQPLGGISRARLVVYKALTDLPHSENGKVVHAPASARVVSAYPPSGSMTTDRLGLACPFVATDCAKSDLRLRIYSLCESTAVGTIVLQFRRFFDLLIFCRHETEKVEL